MFLYKRIPQKKFRILPKGPCLIGNSGSEVVGLRSQARLHITVQSFTAS